MNPQWILQLAACRHKWRSSGLDYYIGNDTIYASGYERVGEYGQVTKHDYSGSQRMATRLTVSV